MNTGIYAIENTVNGKMYIGSAVNLQRRMSHHFSLLRKGTHINGKLQNSYNKHGEESFKPKTLLVCRTEDLLFYEQLVIDKYDVAKTGYNIAPIAGSALGVKRSEETKAKISAVAKAKWADPEFKVRRSAALKVANTAPEVKARRVATLRSSWADPEYKARRSEISKAAWADPEFRAKHSAAIKAARADPEYKARQSAASKTRWADPEFRAKHSAAVKAARADPDNKAKMKIALADPEYRARQSATMKAYYATKKAA